MPKIDTSTIEGYENMTAEEKLAALEGFEYEDHSDLKDEVERQKAAVTKANKEAADAKRQLKEKLSQEEQEAQEKKEAEEKLAKENAELREKVAVSENTTRLLALGYSAELAADTAKAMFDGDNDKVFANQKKFMEEQEKKIKADLLDGTAKPPAGTGGKAMTKEDFAKLSLAEQADFAAKNPEEYAKFYGGN